MGWMLLELNVLWNYLKSSVYKNFLIYDLRDYEHIIVGPGADFLVYTPYPRGIC